MRTKLCILAKTTQDCTGCVLRSFPHSCHQHRRHTYKVRHLTGDHRDNSFSVHASYLILCNHLVPQSKRNVYNKNVLILHIQNRFLFVSHFCILMLTAATNIHSSVVPVNNETQMTKDESIRSWCTRLNNCIQGQSKTDGNISKADTSNLAPNIHVPMM